MFPISDDNPRRHKLPYINIALIAINILVFLYELGLRGVDQDLFFFRYGLIPTQLVHDPLSGNAFLLGRQLFESEIPSWATLFTSMFIHGGVLHILGNMVFLWVFGDNIEDRMGHVPYLVFYIAMGVVAAFAQVAINVNSEVPTIGASGAIAGVLGAYLVLYPFRQVRTLVIFFLITFVRLPAALLLGFWIILQFFNGVLAISTVQSGGVAYWAHIGGFVGGMVVVAVLNVFVWRQPLISKRPEPGGYWRGRRF